MPALRTRLALALGLWTAATVGPPAAYAVGGPFDGTVTPVDVALPAALFAVGVLAARRGLSGMNDPCPRFRDGLELAGLLALPGVVALAAFPLAYARGVTAALPIGAGGAVGFLAAFLVGYLADRRVVARKRARSADRVAWSARKRPGSRYQRPLAGVVVASAAVWGVGVALDGSPVFALVPAIIGVAWLPQLLTGLRRRRYEITDGGLVTQFGHLTWDQFDGFSVSEEALVLHGNVWPFGRLAFDRSSVADEDAVIDALDRHLPRVAAEDSDDPTPLDNLREAGGAR